MQAFRDSPQNLTDLAAARIARTGITIAGMGPLPKTTSEKVFEARRHLTFPVTSRLGSDRSGECAIGCLKGLFINDATTAMFYLEALRDLLTDGWAPYPQDRENIQAIMGNLLKSETRYGDTALALAQIFSDRAWKEDRFTLQRTAEECTRITYIIQATRLPWWNRFNSKEEEILHKVEETRRNLERARTNGRWVHIFNDDILPSHCPMTIQREKDREQSFNQAISMGYEALRRALVEDMLDGVAEAEVHILAAREMAPVGGWWGNTRNRLARLAKVYQDTENLARIEADWQVDIENMMEHMAEQDQ